MNKNKQYPYAFKQEVAYIIEKDVDTDDLIKDYVSKNHTGMNYKKLRNNQRVSEAIILIKELVSKICDYKITKFILGDQCTGTIQENCNKVTRGYYSAAKLAIQKLEIDEKGLREQMGIVGFEMKNNHLGLREGYSNDQENTKKRIMELSAEDQSLLIKSCISKDLKSLPFVLDVLYPDNLDQRYAVIEEVISYPYQNKNNYNKNTGLEGVEAIFFKLKLTDGDRNSQLLKKLIINCDGNIDCSDINKFELKNDQNKKEIVELLLSYDAHDSIVPYIYLLEIQSEDIKFFIAKVVAQKGEYIGVFLKNNKITDDKKLQELAEINSQNITTQEGGTRPINHNFINYVKTFKIPDNQIENYTNRTLTANTIFNVSEAGISNENVLSKIIEKVISVSSIHYSLNKNIGYIIDYIEKLPQKEQDLLYSKLGKYLVQQPKTQEIIKVIKVVLENKKVKNKQYQIIFENYYCTQLSQNIYTNQGIKEYIYKLTSTGYGDMQPSPFSTKLDMTFLISALEKSGYIDSHIKEAILSENKHFEHLKNFVALLFEEESNIKYKPNVIENPLSGIQLSRELFFTKIGLKFPENEVKYHKERIEEFYLITYRLYTIVGKDFFKNLQFDASVFQEDSLIKLTAFFNTVLNIVSIKSLKHNHAFDPKIIPCISAYKFSELGEDISEEMKSTFHASDNISEKPIDSDNINGIASNFSKILVYLFQKELDIRGNTITPEKFYKMNDTWGDIDVIYTLFSHFSGFNNRSIREGLSRITEMEMLETFHEYKYNGYPGNKDDIEMAAIQMSGVNEEQKEIWKKNKQELHYYSPTSNKTQEVNLFDEMYKIIQNGFIDNKHLDEISVGYTGKIVTYITNEEENNCINDINSNIEVDDIITQYPSLKKETLFDLGFVSLLQSTTEKQIVASIKFIKIISNKYKFDISKLKQEFTEILSKKQLLDSNKNESIFFTCETDNPKILLEIGDTVKGPYSCQNYKGGSTYLKALPGYVIDAGVKAILSFEIQHSDLKNTKSWDLLKEYVKSKDVLWEFNEYSRCLVINGNKIEFTTAGYRNIMKLGKNDEKPVLFLEQGYDKLSPDKKEFITKVHNKLKADKLIEMNGDLYAREGTFPESRNPGGIYVDANKSIELFTYTIKF